MKNPLSKSICTAGKACGIVVVLIVSICSCGGEDAEPKVTKVDIVSTTPASPATLTYSQNVQITYNYVVTESDGVRIFVQGMTDGINSTYYSASPVYKDSGSKTVSISVKSDDPSVVVDQLRIRIVNPNQTLVISDTFEDVSYTFTE